MTRPLQNRVLPTGDIVAIQARGTFTGNRGVLHRPDKTLGVSRWKHHAWIICTLTHKDWHREVMTPNRWTELFFLDEATALAAGHRPCALCRRAAYTSFRAFWGEGASAPEIDRVLHAARIVPGTRDQKRTFAAPSVLPDGAMCLHGGKPHLALADAFLPWSPDGYGAPELRGDRESSVLTPSPTLRVLAQGYRPVLHPSALAFFPEYQRG
ncbi:hypothetical protein [Aliiroseovarius subalbicans]|uniref:hypothetical protein n=1 Tax=Aliiroseovarius subalbicans TaxID=2925840 RepID=UPI001F5963E7|nr:hypothetical protein [Aliiroseovarius subalbicans]MCI2398042.1 hypothetical protein [Aliiroseovarius subalbicans]